MAASILVAGLWASVASGQAPMAPDMRDIDPLTVFVLGNLEYVLLHELAHMLINDFDIPIIGPEENAADYLATAALLIANRPDPARAQRAREFLLATANGLATSWEVDSRTGREIRYWDTHSLTIQRFYQIICLVFGSNPETFAALPSRVGMPEQRAARCPAEFAKADRSIQWLLDHYGRRPDDPQGAEISFVIEPPPTLTSRVVLESLESIGMLNNIITRLHGLFTIPSPFVIALRRCGHRQAAWLPAQRELLLCYELMDNYYLLGLNRQAADRQRTLRELGR